MADEPEELGDEPQEKKSKKGISLLGGMLGLVGVAYVGATMGTPSVEPVPQYKGPFVASLSGVDGENVQVNLADTDKNTYLLMGLVAEYDAYAADYLTLQLEDPFFLAKLKDSLLTLAATETRESLSSQNQVESFLLQMREAIDPICFPVHLGSAAGALEADSASGLRPGDSAFLSTLRGRYEDHVLHVDVPNKTLRLDKGDEVGFVGDEVDLMVANEHQNYVFLNVTELDPEFVGELKVGVKGRLRKVLRDYWVLQ